MKRTTLVLCGAALWLAARSGSALQTGRVEIGRNGVYDGTVWITRSTTGSLVFGDPVVGTSVTLSQLLAGRNDHGGLTGLADDDHTQYLSPARHWQTHTASYNDELPIPPDVGNNSTLGGHTADGNIHVLKSAAEIITGAWRFTGTPVFCPMLRIEPVAPGQNGVINFGTGYDSPRLNYLGNYDEFEFTRPLRSTSASLTTLIGSRVSVYTNLDGKDWSGQPAATLTNFASVNGIPASNLLNRGVNEDITGQWDFMAPVRLFSDLTATRMTLDGGNALNTTAVLAIKNLGSTVTRGIDFSNSGLSGSAKYLIYQSPTGYWRADGAGYAGNFRFGAIGVGTAAPTSAGGMEASSMVLTHTESLKFRNATSPYLSFWSSASNRIGWAGYSYNVADFYLMNQTASGKTYLGTSGQTRLTILENGSVGVGDSTPAALFTVGNGDKFQVDGSGNVSLSANAKQTIPDGTDAPFIHTFNAAAARYSDNRETINVLSQSALGVEYQGSGYGYVGFPIPNDVMGGNVVLDRITIYCAQDAGTGESITEIALVDDTNTAVRTYSGNITGEAQWLTSDFTMNDSRSYIIRMFFVSNDAGHLDVTRFKVEYHLE